MQPFKQVKKVVIYNEVAKQIRKAILGGKFHPGDRLPSERKLSEMFGVGRPTIREALKSLSVRGLIELKRDVKGYVVGEPDFKQSMFAVREQISWLIQVDDETVPDFWEVVPNLTGVIAHSAAMHATSKHCDQLERHIAEMEACGDDFYAYGRASFEYSRHMAEITGNRILLILWQMFRDVIVDEYPPILTKVEPNGLGNLIGFHKGLLLAVRNQDHEEIDRLVRERWDHLKTLVRNEVESRHK